LTSARVTLSTHVLDATTGRPAADLHVRLEHRGHDGWSSAGEGLTGTDGRLRLPGMSPFGLENAGEVSYAADRPYGLIEGTVTRDEAPPPGKAW
jgi:5-hydroxyisourate hydrolase-like protein (transthyretin family)